MKKILFIITIFAISAFGAVAETPPAQCERIELGLLDEIVSCKHGDYHVKYKYTNTIDIGSMTSQLSEKSKQVVKLTVLTGKSK